MWVELNALHFTDFGHLLLGCLTERMSNLTQDILYGNNYSQPLLPENPIRYVVDNVHFIRLMLMMIPFWVLSIWLTVYGVNVILCKLFNVVYNLCIEKKEKTVCSGEFECKKGCEHCAGRNFLKHK